MKTKTLFAGLGLTVLLSAGAALWYAGDGASASPYAYHQYMKQAFYHPNATPKMQEVARKNRNFSDLMGPYRYRVPERSRLIHQYFSFAHPTRRHDVWYYPDYRAPQVATLNQNRILGRPELPQDERFAVVDEDNFYLDIPAGFTKGSDGVYRNPRSTFSFRIVRTPEKFHCPYESFTICAINLNKDFREQQKIVQTGSLDNSFRWRQTLEDEFIYYPTLVESFHGNLYGNENVYYTFSALDPEDHSVVRIEIVANQRERIDAADMAQDIIESFRFREQII